MKYAHALYSNGTFVRYEMASKTKRISNANRKLNYDVILPDRGNIVGIKDQSIYRVKWIDMFSGWLNWKNIIIPFQRPDMTVRKSDVELCGSGELTQVQYNSGTQCLLALKGNTINAIDLSNESSQTIKIESEFPPQIFLNGNTGEIICHFNDIIVVYHFHSGEELLRIKDMRHIYVGVGDKRYDNPKTRKIRSNIEYIIGVDENNNITKINL
jgi:hypothetical protein